MDTLNAWRLDECTSHARSERHRTWVKYLRAPRRDHIYFQHSARVRPGSSFGPGSCFTPEAASTSGGKAHQGPNRGAGRPYEGACRRAEAAGVTMFWRFTQSLPVLTVAGIPAMAHGNWNALKKCGVRNWRALSVNSFAGRSGIWHLRTAAAFSS